MDIQKIRDQKNETGIVDIFFIKRELPAAAARFFAVCLVGSKFINYSESNEISLSKVCA